MPVLQPTNIIGKVVWLGRVANRDTTLRSAAIETLELTYAGISGESHSGLTRESCSRVVSQYPRGTEIRNVRQISILSQEEMDQTAETMNIPSLKPEWLGANIILQGIPDFTMVPPSSRLIFGNQTALTIDMENAPCQFPAREIEQELPSKGRLYKVAAKSRRGVTAWVEREGSITLGDQVVLHIPPQRIYPHSNS